MGKAFETSPISVIPDGTPDTEPVSLPPQYVKSHASRMSRLPSSGVRWSWVSIFFMVLAFLYLIYKSSRVTRAEHDDEEVTIFPSQIEMILSPARTALRGLHRIMEKGHSPAANSVASWNVGPYRGSNRPLWLSPARSALHSMCA